MALPSRFRVGAITLLVALAVPLGIALLGDSPSDAANGYRPPKIDQARLLLRLPDLPPGYVNGYLGEGLRADGVVCEAFSRSQDELPALAALVRSYSPKGCIAVYEKLFTPPGLEARAPIVFSGVMALGSAAATDATWNLVPTLLRATTVREHGLTKAPTPLKVGGATRFFHTSAVPLPFSMAGRKASFLAWRSGKVVAVIVAIAKSFAESDATVAELAPRQQEHIRKPTPYTGAERYDGDVGLDDPAIDIPVFWLGRTFKPRDGLPPTKLYGSGYRREPIPEETDGIAEGPYPPLEVNYETVRLATWTPETWHVFANSKTAKAITSWKCTQTRTVTIPGGSATIFGGYKENYARCPKKAPRAFTAWVDVAGVKIVVNSPPAPDFIETVNPYGSFKGMKAIVTSLHERPKPLY